MNKTLNDTWISEDMADTIREDAFSISFFFLSREECTYAHSPPMIDLVVL